nr:hypothetical protein [uncultured Desulfobacter sp.]
MSIIDKNIKVSQLVLGKKEGHIAKRAALNRQPVFKKEGVSRWVFFIFNGGFTAFAAIANYPALNINLAPEYDLNMTPVLSNGNPANQNVFLTVNPA